MQMRVLQRWSGSWWKLLEERCLFTRKVDNLLDISSGYIHIELCEYLYFDMLVV